MINLPTDARPVYTIDVDDRLALVNPSALSMFAPAGGSAQSLLGRSVWDFVAGAQIRQLWQVLYSRVRAAGAPVFVPMRADTPSFRRLVDLELHPMADRSIQHIYECVWTEARPAIALLDPAYPRDERSLPSCAWCRRIQVRFGVWEEIEQAQQTLRIEAVETLPTLKPAVCASCKQSVLRTFSARVA
jgi:hypothetical protein